LEKYERRLEKYERRLEKNERRLEKYARRFEKYARRLEKNARRLGNTNAVWNCSYRSSSKKCVIATGKFLLSRKLNTKVALVAPKVPYERA
jgi:hypothetical protein